MYATVSASEVAILRPASWRRTPSAARRVFGMDSTHTAATPSQIRAAISRELSTMRPVSDAGPTVPPDDTRSATDAAAAVLDPPEHYRQTHPMKLPAKRRTRLWLTAWLVAGGAVLALSWVVTKIDRTEWWAGVLVNLGASALLVSPVYWLTKRLETDVTEKFHKVRDDTTAQVAGLSDQVDTFKRDVDERIGSLADQVNATVREERDRDADLFGRLADDPTEETLRAAFDRAHDRGLVDATRGPRVAIREGQTYLRLDLPRNEDRH